ncbi:phosphotransferase [Alteromonas sp. PRIM-21]|uniref:phosphotransferase n=1 Tax=Alteromonas sp. PRIM-21 TaxID=1454978 RepID=UPI0022B9BA21|nr:phosphotransferase [Alteromonas sp. PRIM-21]MCZ8531378.1 phosphotransferase [Alteromonas sp. PRIM-21]
MNIDSINNVVRKTGVTESSQIKNELFFYNEIAHNFSKLVPKLIFTDEEKSILEIENLSENYVFIEQKRGFNHRESYRTISTYMEIQEKVKGSKIKLSSSKISNWPLNQPRSLIINEIETWISSYTFPSIKNKEIVALFKIFFEQSSKIYDELEMNSMGIIHGDFRCDNIALPKNNGKPKIIDWESFGKGSILIDLTVFLLQSVNIEYQDRVKKTIIKSFCKYFINTNYDDVERLLHLASPLISIYLIRFQRTKDKEDLYFVIEKRMTYFYERNLEKIKAALLK